MKFAVVLLVLVPLVLSVEVDKRGILDFLGFPHWLDMDKLKQTAQHVLDTMGSDATEQQCETSCHSFLAVDESSFIHNICSPLCHSFQKIVALLGIIPAIGK